MEAWAAPGTPAAQRLACIKGILSREPEAQPGTAFKYSIQGYAIAGVMLEQASGMAWAELAKYAAFHLAGERGEARLLAPEAFRKLHAPMGGGSRPH